MKRLPLLIAFAALLVALSSSCLRAQRAHRLRAEAEQAEAEAELARARADATRAGEIGADEDYVEGEAAPQPPAPVAESIPPAPSSAHIWIAGAHVWRRGAWIWTRGHWVAPPRPGARWEPGRWIRRGRGHVWIVGVWR
jgi:hypothetical protein